MFRTATPHRTPCEVLREINDLCQSDSEKDKAIRQKLWECQRMIKMLGLKVELLEPQNWDCWWQPLEKYLQRIEKRIKANYKTYRSQLLKQKSL